MCYTNLLLPLPSVNWHQLELCHKAQVVTDRAISRVVCVRSIGPDLSETTWVGLVCWNTVYISNYVMLLCAQILRGQASVSLNHDGWSSGKTSSLALKYSGLERLCVINHRDYTIQDDRCMCAWKLNERSNWTLWALVVDFLATKCLTFPWVAGKFGISRVVCKPANESDI